MGQCKGDLYVLSKPKEVHFSNRQNSRTEEVWHKCLGHPQKSVVQFLCTKNLIHVSSNKKVETACESCQLGKLSKLTFSLSHSSSTNVFEKINYDIWGPTPILYHRKFPNYACFVDDYSYYVWLIPLCAKSNFIDVYLAYEIYLKLQFEKKIKIFHSDGGGEFVNKRLALHFQQQGIVHQLSYPHTPEKTDFVGRCHHTIRELGMTMIFHSGVPNFLWVEAFTTTTFLINRLPSSSVNFNSPYFRLYGVHPNYFILRVFGT